MTVEPIGEIVLAETLTPGDTFHLSAELTGPVHIRVNASGPFVDAGLSTTSVPCARLSDGQGQLISPAQPVLKLSYKVEPYYDANRENS